MTLPWRRYATPTEAAILAMLDAEIVRGREAMAERIMVRKRLCKRRKYVPKGNTPQGHIPRPDEGPDLA